MTRHLKGLSSFTFANIISVFTPIFLVPFLVIELSIESYNEMVTGQLTYFYSSILIGFGLNTSGLLNFKLEGSNVIGWTNMVGVKSIMFVISFLAAISVSFLHEFSLIIILYAIISMFEIFNLTPLVIFLEKPKYLIIQRFLFSVTYFCLVILFLPKFPFAETVAITYFFSLLFSNLYTYQNLLKDYSLKKNSSIDNFSLIRKSYKYFLSQVGGQIYASIPRLLALNLAGGQLIKIIDVLEKIIMVFRIIISSITSWFGGIYLKSSQISQLSKGTILIFIICSLLYFVGLPLIEIYLFDIIGLEKMLINDLILIIALLLLITGINIKISGYYFLKRGKEIFALFFLIFSCLLVFKIFEINEDYKSIYMLMLYVEICVLIFSILFLLIFKLFKNEKS